MAIDLLETGTTKNLYNTDLFRSISSIFEIWNQIECSVVYKCWVKTGLLSDHHTAECPNMPITSLFNIGTTSEIEFDSYFPDEHNCYDHVV